MVGRFYALSGIKKPNYLLALLYNSEVRDRCPAVILILGRKIYEENRFIIGSSWFCLWRIC